MSQELKKIITYEALQMEIQALLDGCKPECSDLYVDLITLHNINAHNCNWTVNILRRNGGKSPLDTCEARIAEGINDFKRRFDVSERLQNLSALA